MLSPGLVHLNIIWWFGKNTTALDQARYCHVYWNLLRHISSEKYLENIEKSSWNSNINTSQCFPRGQLSDGLVHLHQMMSAYVFFHEKNRIKDHGLEFNSL